MLDISYHCNFTHTAYLILSIALEVLFGYSQNEEVGILRR